MYLDLATIMQAKGLPGELIGEIPARIIGNKAPWKVRLRLEEGRITLCQIIDHQGAVVNSGKQALEMVRRLGWLDWDIQDEGPGRKGRLPSLEHWGTEVAKRNTPIPDLRPNSSLVPIRTVEITLQRMNETGWPHEYRLIYMLVDGVRNSEMIASTLQMPPAEVEQILLELKKMLLIDLKPQQ